MSHKLLHAAILSEASLAPVGGALRKWADMQPKYPKGKSRWLRLAKQGGKFVWKQIRPASRLWVNYDGKSTLLLLHGTGRRTTAGFRVLVNSPQMATLWSKYEGRVLAFDHRTSADSVKQNVKELLHGLPPGFVLNANILAHSRGGLVARYLAEGWINAAQRKVWPVKIGTVVFMGTPNDGTPTAGKGKNPKAGRTVWKWNEHLRQKAVVDWRNNEVPPTYATRAELRRLATPVLRPITKARKGGSFAGIRDMFPNSALLRKMNGSGPAPSPQAQAPKYRFVASNFHAEYAEGPGGLKSYAGEVQHAIFGDVENDHICPCGGVFAPQGFAGPAGLFGTFNPNHHIVFKPEAFVTHVGYLQIPWLRRRIAQWL